jgi:hypothetical protein
VSDKVSGFIGAAMLGVGALMAVLCGSCTLLTGGDSLVSLVQGKDVGLSWFVLALAVLVGGVPTAAGVLLAVNGWKILKARPPPASPPPP